MHRTARRLPERVGGNRLSGKLEQSPFGFRRHGGCGMEISELFPQLATHADERHRELAAASEQPLTALEELRQIVPLSPEFGVLG